MVKWGIIGPGKIAKKFAADIALVPNALLCAVASRTESRAEAFAKEFNVKQFYDSYEALFADKEVDIIYIATPHTNHAELSIKAMRSGKHVLCEKPLGINAKEVKSMIQTSKENDVFLMEGLWSRFNPTINAIKNDLDKGKIGSLSYLYASFAFYALNREEDSRLLNVDLAGGSILDIGIYPVFLAYLLLGKPETILAKSNFYKTGAEVQTSVIFTYANAQAVLYSGLTANSQCNAELSGSQGTILVPGKWHEAQGYQLEKNGESNKVSLPTKGNGFTYEIEEVQKCLAAGKKESTLWSHKNSLELAELLDAIRKEVGAVFPFE